MITLGGQDASQEEEIKKKYCTQLGTIRNLFKWRVRAQSI
jgi:hypothetical protein